MVQARGYHPGGILSLCLLIEEHGEAIEYELISHGLRLRNLGSEDFNWRDLKVIVRQCPRDSAIARAVEPDAATWGVQEQLLAEIADTLHWLQWTKTKDAAAKPPRNAPDPIPRPGIKPKQVEVYKYDVMTQDEALEWLGWTRPIGE